MGMYHGAVREEKDAEAVFPWLGEIEKVFLTEGKSVSLESVLWEMGQN